MLHLTRVEISEKFDNVNSFYKENTAYVKMSTIFTCIFLLPSNLFFTKNRKSCHCYNDFVVTQFHQNFTGASTNSQALERRFKILCTMCRTFCVLRRIFQKNRENTYSLYSYLPFYNYTLSIWNRYRPSGALLFQQKVTIPHSKHYFPRSEIYHWSRWYQFFSQIFRFSICYKRFTSSQNTQKP